jgi:hypothetical protein
VKDVGAKHTRTYARVARRKLHQPPFSVLDRDAMRCMTRFDRGAVLCRLDPPDKELRKMVNLLCRA